jgi:hypothetical protein
MPDTHEARCAVSPVESASWEGAGRSDAWSYPTFPPPIQSELFDTDSESDASQSRQMPGRLKLPKPQRPCAVCVQDPGEAPPSWGLCFCLSGRLRRTFGIDDDVFGDALPRPAFDCPALPPIRVPAADLTAFAPKRHRNNDSDRL